MFIMYGSCKDYRFFYFELFTQFFELTCISTSNNFKYEVCIFCFLFNYCKSLQRFINSFSFLDSANIDKTITLSF